MRLGRPGNEVMGVWNKASFHCFCHVVHSAIQKRNVTCASFDQSNELYFFAADCMFQNWVGPCKTKATNSSPPLLLPLQATVTFLILLQPALLLIDHGHFQYNCISLGLALWGIVALVTQHDILGSIAFTLALNYKQMELYHAVPFFCYLLGKALRTSGTTPFRKITFLGFTVILTFLVCWFPFLTRPDLVPQVLHRIFPFARGLYEDKVANFWCTVSVLVKVRQLFSQATLARVSLGTTLVALLPSSWNLLRNPTPYRFILALVRRVGC